MCASTIYQGSSVDHSGPFQEKSGSVLLLQPFCQQSLKPLVAWRRDVMESSTNMKTLRPTLHPCGTFLFKVSDHNVLCLNHSKGKVKLDFFLIKAIF